MGHTLFAGVTESGKTTLARYISRKLCALNNRVVVYDPMGTPTAGGEWGEKAVIFRDDTPERFLKYLDRSDVNHAHVFCDEAGDYLTVSDKENHWLFRRGRHKGLFMYPIMQRPKMVAPNVRSMCGTAFVFRLAVDDADEIGKDFGHTKLSNIVSTLDTGQYVKLKSGSPKIERGDIFQTLKGIES